MTFADFILWAWVTAIWIIQRMEQKRTNELQKLVIDISELQRQEWKRKHKLTKIKNN